MRRLLHLLIFALLLSMAAAAFGQTLVDVVNDATDPTNLDDSEPSIAVNPINPLEIAIVAFSGSWSATNAPVFKSTDGGSTWSRITQLGPPTGFPASNGPGDQKIVYTAAGNLMVAELAMNVAIPRCFVYRQTGAANDPLSSGMAYGDDQPMIESDKTAASPFFNRTYSAWLDFSFPNPLSTVARSTDAGVNVTNVGAGDNSSFPLRTTRSAVAPNGDVYIVYKTREGAVDANFENAHFRVNRSTDGGVTWTGTGSAAGVSVTGATQQQTWFTTSWGNAAKGKVGRARSSDAWIGIHPTNGTIWVVYCDQDASGFGQIYSTFSTTNGTTWSAPVRVTDGTRQSAFPEVAVAANGTPGVMYIDFDDSGAQTNFRHRFARSFDGGANWSNLTLQTLQTQSLMNGSNGFLWGDYEGLAAVGHTFYGVFTGQSIGRASVQFDPIFFRISSTDTARDFYVRDWTDSAISGDDGAEPSTHAVFYSTSDVWNQRSNVAPTFNANDQPNNEPPGNGAGAAGDNWMFARVKRNASGAAQTVTTHFLYSEFGTGSNYQDAGNPLGTDVAFGAADTSVTMPSGHPWNLPATSSDHLCLAVEISTPDDPFMPPTLLGRAPGWPTTDLTVLTDNNKAQRNTSVFTESGESAAITYYGVIHNPATKTRDVVLQFESSGGTRIGVVGDDQNISTGTKGRVVLRSLLPAENRWITIRFDKASLPGRGNSVSLTELQNGRAINGFELRTERGDLGTVMVQNIRHRATLYRRLGSLRGDRELLAASEKLGALSERGRIDERTYLDMMQLAYPQLAKAIDSLGDELPTGKYLEEAVGAARSGKAEPAAEADGVFLHAADASTTMEVKRRGDAADIAQMLQWQLELATDGTLSREPCASSVARASTVLLASYRARKAKPAAYAAHLRTAIPCVGKLAPKVTLTDLAKAGTNAAALQTLHRKLLLSASGN
jgi:hypothetical protein